MKRLVDMLVNAGVVKRGTFRLASGKSADYYIDLKSVYGRPSVLSALAKEIAACIPKRTTVVASGGYGGIPLATAVALRLRLPLTLVRSEQKLHGTFAQLDGYVPTRGDRIALIDDVFTTGGSMKKMEQILRPTGARILGRFVVVNRSSTRPRGVRALVNIKRLIR